MFVALSDLSHLLSELYLHKIYESLLRAISKHSYQPNLEPDPNPHPQLFEL